MFFDRYEHVSLVKARGVVLLTSWPASKADRTIRMWRVQKSDDTKDIEFTFVRNFVGHRTGIICLEKVDDKGRFLAASKDRYVRN